MKEIDSSSFHLIFADPPYNINYPYDSYKDALPKSEYLLWSKKWLTEVARLLKPNGSFWLAINDENVAELKLFIQNELKLFFRSWVIWYYTFGNYSSKNFARSHTHLLYFVKNSKNFIFNASSGYVPSVRLLDKDIRANAKGKLPDNTWILRPEEALLSFQEIEDTWYFPRVAGTFKARQTWHPCHLPEKLLERIIKFCSNEGDFVFDPFVGSGTTLVTAKKLNRQYFGCEISKSYVEKIKERLGE